VIASRLLLLLRAKSSKRDRDRDGPGELLDASYRGQVDVLVEVRHGIAALVTAKKQLEGHAGRFAAQAERLHAEARNALEAGREDLAREALRRRSFGLAQAAELGEQIAVLQSRQDRLLDGERAFTERIRWFRAEKERLKADYDSAKATVELREAAAGLADRVSAAAQAVERARAKRAELEARDPPGPPGSERDADFELARLKSARSR
jgi:phage shock protein A